MILPPDQLAHSDTSYLLFPGGNDVGLPEVCREGEREKGFSLVLFLSSLVCYPFLAEKARGNILVRTTSPNLPQYYTNIRIEHLITARFSQGAV